MDHSNSKHQYYIYLTVVQYNNKLLELKQYNKVILIDQMVIAIASSNDNKLQLLLKMNVKE